MRAGGIRIGVYFSLIGWHHPDYPAATDADQLYVLASGSSRKVGRGRAFTRDVRADRRLLTNCGKIDVIWFDGGWERSTVQWRSARNWKRRSASFNRRS